MMTGMVWLGGPSYLDVRASVALLIMAVAKTEGLQVESVPSPIPGWDVIQVKPRQD